MAEDRPPILVTGGAGFIGSAVVRELVRLGAPVVNVDALTYAGDLSSVESVADAPGYTFEHVDIRDADAVQRLFEAHRPRAVLHLAAESHVDRSIAGPAAFVETNVVGTFTLLDAALRHWQGLPEAEQAAFRFLHVSTDEVYGELGADGAFTERSPYAPNSPYSASKAASDHLVRAWNRTYGLPTLTTHCSNNYGPFQHPEKLIPVVTRAAAEGRPVPIYGSGTNVRDWLHVDDHVGALLRVLEGGVPGDTYAIGGGSERTTVEVARAVCAALDELRPAGAPHDRHIAFVADRPGHDFRYAIDASKIADALGWRPSVGFDEGVRSTVSWYLDRYGWAPEPVDA